MRIAGRVQTQLAKRSELLVGDTLQALLRRLDARIVRLGMVPGDPTVVRGAWPETRCFCRSVSARIFAVASSSYGGDEDAGAERRKNERSGLQAAEAARTRRKARKDALRKSRVIQGMKGYTAPRLMV